MLCPCCILPLIFQSFGISLDYKLYVLILIIQLFFLYLNKTKWKQEKNNIHIYIAILLNIIIIPYAYYNLLLTYKALRYSFMVLNIINIFVGLYRNRNVSCKDNSCKHKH